jgi:hypothetical protein
VKTALKIIGIVCALVLLGGVMAYLAGFFETKIPVDFSGVVPSADNGREFTVEITTQPLIEQSAGTVRAKVETVISPLITATISSIGPSGRGRCPGRSVPCRKRLQAGAADL